MQGRPPFKNLKGDVHDNQTDSVVAELTAATNPQLAARQAQDGSYESGAPG